MARHMSTERAAREASKEMLLDLLQLILNKSRIDPALAKKLYYARRMGYVEKNKLTKKGRELLSERKTWGLTLPTPRRWDGKWHLVMFDIPKDKRKRRDAFRSRLRELGLALYQNSVWIYPYPLEETVGKIAEFYKLTSCVSFIVAEKISDEYNFIKRFKL